MYEVRNISNPVVQFRSKSVLVYNQYVIPASPKQSILRRLRAKENFGSNKSYSGEMTIGARKRLTKAVSLLVQSSKTTLVKNPVTKREHPFKLSFITLTIPECEIKPDAKTTNKLLLEPFLRVLRRRYSLKNYVWKLELQSNGMIHYHLTSNVFTNHVNIRNEWNAILQRNGFLDDYKKRTGNSSPNSTDIHAVQKVKDMEAYLVKYVTKEIQNNVAVNAKIWDCSRALKTAEYFSTDADWSYTGKLEKHVDQGVCTCYTGERYRIYRYKESPAKVLLTPTDYKSYIIHLNNIRNGKTTSKRAENRALQSRGDDNASHGELPPSNHLPRITMGNTTGGDAATPRVVKGRVLFYHPLQKTLFELPLPRNGRDSGSNGERWRF